MIHVGGARRKSAAIEPGRFSIKMRSTEKLALSPIAPNLIRFMRVEPNLVPRATRSLGLKTNLYLQ
jgi:hypothetical protein